MKTDIAVNLKFFGRAASPGHARGPITFVSGPIARTRETGTPEQEAAALRQAKAQAVLSLAHLIEKSDSEASDILAFQVAMLEDDALTEGAFHAIETGIGAGHAWASALESEIAGYLAAEEDYFRARASDLADLKERVLDALNGTVPRSVIRGSIILADDFSPSRFLSHDWADGGLVLRKGSPASHVAMLARSRGVPMIIGAEIPDAPGLEGAAALLDGGRGLLIVDPDAATAADFTSQGRDALEAARIAATFARGPGMSANGINIAVNINIADVAELDHFDPALCDGIGLVRTELLFEGKALPDEAAQFLVYRRIAEWAEGRTVTIRTLDAGGDKPIAGVTPEAESNPFLGMRGVRLTLRRPDLFKVQLRALARAAAHGDVQIMAPMVSVPRELAATRALLDEALGELAREGALHRRPRLGMMVEVPAAAISIIEFDADFYSIGSNDLTQYVMAAGRDIEAVADLADAGNSAVIALVRQVVAHGRALGKPVSLCGDAASDTAVLPKLLGAGLLSVSVAPGLVGATKACIATLTAGSA